jgi:hypothetical protein
MISQYFTRGHYARLRLAGNVIETRARGRFQRTVTLRETKSRHTVSMTADCEIRLLL